MGENVISINWPAMPQLLVGAVILVQGILVFIQNPRASLNRAFLCFFFPLFIWMSGMGMSYFLTDGKLALVFMKIGFFGVMYIPIGTYIFSVYYRGDQRQKKFILPGVLATISISLFINHPILVSGIREYPWGFYIDLGPLSAAVLMLFALFIPLYVRNLYQKYKQPPLEKRRWASLAFLTGSLAFFGASDFLPAYGISLLPFPPLGYLIAGGLSSLMTYFILRHRLLDIRIIVGRTIGYSFITGFIFFLYAGIFIVLLPQQTAISTLLINAVLFVSLLFILAFLKQKTQRVVDEVFLKEKIDFERSIASFNLRLRNLRTSSSLLKTLFFFFTDELRIESSLVLMFQVEQMRMVLYRNGNMENREQERLDAATLRDFEGFFSEHPSLIHIHEIEQKIAQVPIREKLLQLMRMHNVFIVIPLVHRSSLLGFVMLGEKSSSKGYTSQDVNALENIAVPFAVAWQNAMLYEHIQRASKAKSDFISIASHQLRTPLTHVKWTLSEILSYDAQRFSKKQKSLMEAVYASTDNMITLIKQLLDVARIETEQFFANLSSFAVLPAMQEVIESHHVLVQQKNHSVQRAISEDLPLVYADREHTKVIFDVIVENAMHYTPPKGIITVSVREITPQSVEIAVQDNGIGIPEDQQQHIFTKFFRANNAISTVPNGTGLGLFYAKALAQKQGSEIWFKSQEGEGTTFFIALPRAV